MISAKLTGPAGTVPISGDYTFRRPPTDDDIKGTLAREGAKHGLGPAPLISVHDLAVTPL